MKKRFFKMIISLIVTGLLVAVVGNVIVCLAANSLLRDSYSNYFDRVSKILAGVKVGTSTAEPGMEEENKISQLQFFTDGYSFSEMYTAIHIGIYDKSEEKFICESSDDIHLIEVDRSNGTKEGYRYFCKVLNKDEIHELLLKHSYNSIEATAKVNSIARKGLECYITDITFTTTEGNDVNEKRFTFDIDEPGFETIKASDEISIYNPTANSNDYMGYTDSIVKKLNTLAAINDEKFENIKREMISSKYNEEERLNQYNLFAPHGESHLYFGQSAYGSDGKEYRVIACMTFNIRMFLLKYFLLDYALIVAIAMIIFFICEKIRSTKEKAKKESEEYRKNLTDAMAHDLKSPLTVISGYAETLKENINEDKREHYAQAIIDNVDSMNRSIENMLVLSELEKQNNPKKTDEISLAELTRESFSSFEHILSEKNLTLNIDGDKQLICNKELMQKLMGNLVINSVSYAKAPGKIEVSITEREFIMQNEIEAIPDLDVKELTEPFTRGNKERGGVRGSGLGLSIAKTIAGYHDIKLEPEIKDNLFIVHLYLAKNK